MTALFISDLHLDESDEARLGALDRTLQLAISEDAEIYVLGDLVEVWVGDDDNSKFADSLRQTLRRYGEQTSLFLMHGNRDFLFGEKFVSDINARLLVDPSTIELNGQRFLLSHGDVYCTSDTAYQRMRKTFRSEEFQNNFLSQDLDMRRSFARIIREQSRQSNANKPEQITDVVDDAVRTSLMQHGCSTVIHGHTHRPGLHDLGDGLSRYVLGSWERCGWRGWFRDGFLLECFEV